MEAGAMPQTYTAFSKLTQDTFELGRNMANTSAIWLERCKPAGRQLTDTGVALTELARESAELLLRQQLTATEQGIDLAGKRLERAAEADDFKQLLQEQWRLLPESAARIRGDVGSLAHIYFDMRAKFNALARDTVDALLVEPAEHAPPSRRKKAT
jgi:hypothetical protein